MGTVVSRLLGLEDGPEGLRAHVCWKGLRTDENTFKSVSEVAKNVPQLFDKLCEGRSAPKDFVTRTYAEFAFSERKV